MEPRRLLRATARHASTLPRRWSALRGGGVTEEPVELVSTAGYQLAARVYVPDVSVRGVGQLPGLVISPAIRQGLAGLGRWTSPVTPQEIARLGYVVLAHDPAGRGDSWGDDDFGGPEHADDLRVAVRALRARADVRDVAVLSLSLGLAAACAALATWPEELDARWLLDWEGPSDREVITSGGKRMSPAMGHTLEDDTYWHPREAVRHVGRLRCGYVRLQAVPDHAQPAEVRHAQRMIHAAAAGTLPWFQLNDHPRGVDPQRPSWHRGGTLAANRQILAKLAELRDVPNPVARIVSEPRR